MKKSLMLVVCALAALWLSGCAYPWTVVRQAEPNPFLGKKDFVVMPIDYTDLRVGSKTEEEYLSEKKDKTVDSFLADKDAMNDIFIGTLKDSAASEGVTVREAAGEIDTYVIKPHIGRIEPGFYAFVASKPSEVIMRLRIENKDGKLLDEIELRHQTSAQNFANVAAGSRYRTDAEWIGQIAGQYLGYRVHNEE